MSIKITFDNNVLDRYEEWPVESEKQYLTCLLKTRRIAFYPTPELVEETLGLIKTERVQKLPQRAAWLLEVMGRPLNYYGDIVIGELRGNKQIFLETSTASAMKAKLSDLAIGNIPNALDQAIEQSIERKTRDQENYKAQQDRIREAFPHLDRLQERPGTLEEFDRKYWANWLPHFIEDLCRKGDIHDPALKARGVIQQLHLLRGAENVSHPSGALSTVNAPKKEKHHPLRLIYPYLKVCMKVHSVMFYRYFVRNRKVGFGDVYDAAQIVSMVGLDWMVTEDEKLREVFGMVFGASKRIFTFSEFMCAVKNLN